MSNYEIKVFLLSLREEGCDFYTIEETLLAYRNMIESLANGQYSETQDELCFDMEFRRNVLEPIETIIKNDIKSATNAEKKFLQDLEDLDNNYYRITIPTPMVIDNLPFWFNRILKRGSRFYAEDVKLAYGIDIEIVE